MKKGLLLIILLLNFIHFSAHSQTKPLFYYPFNGNANDESGNGNSCTNYGASLTTDRFGNENSAYYFDGINDYMKIIPNSDVDSLTDFTISLWFSHYGWNKTNSIYSTDSSIIGLQYIVNGHTESQTNYNPIEGIGVGLILNSDSTADIDAYYHWGKTDPANNRVVQKIKYPLHDTKWTHIVWMRKNGKDYSYINGQLTTNPKYLSNNPSSDFIDQQHPLYFGSANGLLVKNYQFKGKIDDVRIYNNALNESEITNIYNAQPVNITVNSIKEEINGNDGAIDITVNGGVEPFKYSWSNSTNSEDLSNGNATTYTVTVTDSYLNTKIQSFTINKLDPLNISLNDIKDEVNGNDGSIDIIVNGGKYPYSFNWDNNAVSEDIANLKANKYTVTVTDSYLNTKIQSFTINKLDPLNISLNDIKDEVNGNDGSIDILIIGGKKPYTYLWSNNAESEDITDLKANNYTVTVTDSYFNTQILSFTINKLSPLSISLNDIKDEINGKGGFIDISITGGKPPYKFLWSNNAITEDISNLKANLYTVTVIDSYKNQLIKPYTILNKLLYSISGNIKSNGKLINEGYVIAFNKTNNNWQPYTYSNIKDDGTYQITDLPISDYILYTITSEKYLSEYIPTYYYNNNSWEDAFSIHLDGFAINVNFDLVELSHHSEIGFCKITGKIQFENQSLYLFQTHTLNNDTYSIANQPIFLLKNGYIIATTLSDNNGTFYFNNIADGTYEILISNPSQKEYRKNITVQSNQSTENEIILNITKDLMLGDPYVKDDGINIYPNPVINKMSFSEQCDIKIYSLQNQLLLEEKNTSNIDVSFLIQGTYIIEIINDKNFKIQKIIKQ